jgi:membrane protein YdbS with pleckstrin-like domain
MAPRNLPSNREQLLLGASVSVLLSCGVGNVLLAVTESVVWPLIIGVVWTVVAAVVTGLGSATTPPRSTMSCLTRVPVRGVIETL